MTVSIQVSLSVSKFRDVLHVIVCLTILTSIIYYLVNVNNQFVSTCFVFNVATYYFFQKENDEETTLECIRRRCKQIFELIKIAFFFLYKIFKRLFHSISKAALDGAKQYLAQSRGEHLNLKRLRDDGFEVTPSGKDVTSKELPGLVASSNESESR